MFANLLAQRPETIQPIKPQIKQQPGQLLLVAHHHFQAKEYNKYLLFCDLYVKDGCTLPIEYQWFLVIAYQKLGRLANAIQTLEQLMSLSEEDRFKAKLIDLWREQGLYDKIFKILQMIPQNECKGLMGAALCRFVDAAIPILSITDLQELGGILQLYDSSPVHVRYLRVLERICICNNIDWANGLVDTIPDLSVHVFISEMETKRRKWRNDKEWIVYCFEAVQQCRSKISSRSESDGELSTIIVRWWVLMMHLHCDLVTYHRLNYNELEPSLMDLDVQLHTREYAHLRQLLVAKVEITKAFYIFCEIGKQDFEKVKNVWESVLVALDYCCYSNIDTEVVDLDGFETVMKGRELLYILASAVHGQCLQGEPSNRNVYKNGGKICRTRLFIPSISLNDNVFSSDGVNITIPKSVIATLSGINAIVAQGGFLWELRDLLRFVYWQYGSCDSTGNRIQVPLLLSTMFPSLLKVPMGTRRDELTIRDVELFLMLLMVDRQVKALKALKATEESDFEVEMWYGRGEYQCPAIALTFWNWVVTKYGVGRTGHDISSNTNMTPFRGMNLLVAISELGEMKSHPTAYGLCALLLSQFPDRQEDTLVFAKASIQKRKGKVLLFRTLESQIQEVMEYSVCNVGLKK
jgi:hypothetical protein